jgi:hypothetical protein
MSRFLTQVETKPNLLPPRIVIYGRGGIGKTTFAASIPGVVFLPAEEGEGVLHYARLPKPESFDDALAMIEELRTSDHSYRALAIDTLDHLEPLVWRKTVEVANASSKKQMESIEDFGYGKGYVHADEHWRDLFAGLDALRRERKMTCVLLAHAEVKTVEDPTLGSFERVQTKLHKRANALAHEWADIVGFAEIEKSARTDSEGKREVRLAIATGRRLLHLEDRGGFDAKNRYALPPCIDLSWDTLRSELVKSIEAAKPANGEAA